MPKNVVNAKQLVEASKQLLSENSGSMEYGAWKSALEGKLGNVDKALSQVASRKMVIFWLDGFDQEGKPNMLVLSQFPPEVLAQMEAKKAEENS